MLCEEASFCGPQVLILSVLSHKVTMEAPLPEKYFCMKHEN